MAVCSLAGVSLLLLGALAVSVTESCRVTASWETKDHLIEMHVQRSPSGHFTGTFKEAGQSCDITGFQRDENSAVTFIVTSQSTASSITYMGQCFTVPDNEDRLILFKLKLDPVNNPTNELKIGKSKFEMKRIYMV